MPVIWPARGRRTIVADDLFHAFLVGWPSERTHPCPEGLARSPLGIEELNNRLATVAPGGSGLAFATGHRPLSRPLQPSLRFLRHPIPPHSTGRLAASLPARRSAPASSGAYHVPRIADNRALRPTACPGRACLSCGRIHGDVPPFATGATSDVPFWSRPNSRFGRSIVTQVQTTVHLRCPFGTSLAPSPPSCWQIPGHTSRCDPPP